MNIAPQVSQWSEKKQFKTISWLKTQNCSKQQKKTDNKIDKALIAWGGKFLSTNKWLLASTYGIHSRGKASISSWVYSLSFLGISLGWGSSSVRLFRMSSGNSYAGDGQSLSPEKLGEKKTSRRGWKEKGHQFNKKQISYSTQDMKTASGSISL